MCVWCQRIDCSATSASEHYQIQSHLYDRQTCPSKYLLIMETVRLRRFQSHWPIYSWYGRHSLWSEDRTDWKATHEVVTKWDPVHNVLLASGKRRFPFRLRHLTALLMTNQIRAIKRSGNFIPNIMRRIASRMEKRRMSFPTMWKTVPFQNLS